MQQIIQKAKEGGWINTFEEASLGKSLMENAPNSMLRIIVTLPLFWQALGKACGWAEKRPTSTPYSKEEWFWRATKFYEINLTEGWEKAVKYLEDLIK